MRDSIDRASDAALSFGGATTVTIPRGRAVMSDPVALVVPPLSEVSISLYLTHVPAALTGHPGSRQTSFVAAGNHVGERALAGAVSVEHWYVISGAEAISSGVGSVVVLGNSIADGRGSGTDRNDRWPDNLARRLADGASENEAIGVLNAGIGGNAVVRGGLGPTALARFQRDVLEQQNAKWAIVSEGVNDIGGARPDSSAVVAQHLIDAYGDMIRRAHAAGMKVYGATILPFGGSQYSSAEHEAARQTVNRWIRGSGAFDAVIDFDDVMRDRSDATRLRGDGDSGDHLHPNELGYRVMADAIELGLFRPRR
jgi:lysophospholipase L1-like esterase